MRGNYIKNKKAHAKQLELMEKNKNMMFLNQNSSNNGQAAKLHYQLGTKKRTASSQHKVIQMNRISGKGLISRHQEAQARMAEWF